MTAETMSYFEPYYWRSLLPIPKDTPEAKEERRTIRLDRVARMKRNIALAPSRSLYAINYQPATGQP